MWQKDWVISKFYFTSKKSDSTTLNSEQNKVREELKWS